MSITTAQLVVKSLENQGVKIIFGIPGAKIDTVFDALVNSKIRLILCRHEQNAAFMAAAYGRRTGKPGVVLVTSGPGVANLTTGLLTATTEGDPVVAIAGNVPLSMKFKETHQNTDNARLLAPVTKSSIEVTTPETVPEAFANAFRISTAARSGACFISLPQDVLMMESDAKPSRAVANICYGHATLDNIDKAAEALSKASSPMLLLGEEATMPENVSAIQHLVRKHQIPVVCTYQGAGVISKELMNFFYGRVGLFKNQPGDRLIAKSDLIITIGFNLVEYDPEVWNAKEDKKIIHIDSIAANIHNQYQPSLELLGNIHDNINLLADKTSTINNVFYPELQDELNLIINSGKNKIGKGDTIHPLRFIHELNKVMDQDTIICCDIGSVYMWLARYLFSNHPHQILFSNGQQTLGVALPWALSTKLTLPKKKVISISGDGGFLFSAMELETAVREKIQFTHFIWTDGCYNMVKEQQIMKYNRTSGVNLGAINIPKFAESFGAKGYAISDPNDIVTTLKKAQEVQLPTLIDVAIDYSDNPMMFLDAHNPDLS